jgi:hypothetical protein
MKGILFAAIDAPTPLPQRMMPRPARYSRKTAPTASASQNGRMVHRIPAAGTHVEDLVIVLDQRIFHLLLQVETGMIMNLSR